MKNRKMGEPLYIAISESIKADIIDGKWNPGDLLPSENELAESYSASRGTVRQGLQNLESQGYIYPRAGMGYFVASPQYNKFTFEFTENNTNSEVKGIKVISPTDEVRQALRLMPHQKVVKIERVASIGGLPSAYDLKFLPYEIGQPSIENEIHFAIFPEIAAAKTAPFAFYADIEISAEAATGKVKNYLQCTEGEPLLVIRRHYIGKDKSIIGYGVKYFLKHCGVIYGHSDFHNI